MHEGHRERLRRRFLQEGLDNFDELQVLELLLFYAIPRRDTNPIAHALLEQFGSLSGVLEAPVSALAQVPGMGENAATLIQLVTATSRYYMVQRSSAGQALNTVERCGAYLTPRFFGLRDEAVCALCLDAKCKPLACRILGRGSVNAAGVPSGRLWSLRCPSTPPPWCWPTIIPAALRCPPMRTLPPQSGSVRLWTRWGSF